MGLDERSKGNYQPWNQEGFNADIYVRKMTAIQRWMYKTLLQEAFVCTTRPKLPDKDEVLWMMADCEDLQQWLNNKEAVLARFTKVEVDGVLLLSHNRLESDWANLVNKREKASDAGKRSAEARSTKRNVGSTDVQRPSTSKVKESKEEQSKEELEESSPENGQEDDMKAVKQIPIICQQILHTKADMFPDRIAALNAYAVRTSNGQLIREFEEWCLDHIDDDFRGHPISAFLKNLDDPRVAERKEAAEDPRVTHLVRELAYRSDNTVTFDNRAKAGLAKLLADGNTMEELVSIFRTDFFPPIKEDPYKLKFAAKDFVEKADQLIYTLRRKKAEREAEELAKANQVERMQLEAEQERIRRQEVAKQEEMLVESELPD